MILLFFYLYGNDPLGTPMAFISTNLFIFAFALIIASAILLILAKWNKKVPETVEPVKNTLRKSVSWTTEDKMREFKTSFDPTKKV